MDRRWTAIAVVGVATLLLVAGLISGRWLVGSTPGDDIRVGLLGVDVCKSGHCEHRSFSELGGSSMRPIGGVLIAIGVLAIASLLLTAILAAGKRVVHWFIAPETIAIVLSASALLHGVITLAYFQSALRGIPLGTGPSFLLFGLGAALGLFGAILLGRLPRDDSLQFEPPFDPL